MALGKGLGSLIPSGKAVKVSAEPQEKRAAAAGGRDLTLEIPVADILPNRRQPRQDFERGQLDELVASIKTSGVLQPILVIELPEGGYELIAGERRLRAAKLAGLRTIPAVVRSATDSQRLEYAVVENIQRQDLNPIELARAYRRLADEFGMTHQEISDRVGKNRSTISNFIRLLDLPEEMQDALIAGKVSVGDITKIMSLRKESDMLDVFRRLMDKEIPSRDVLRTVRKKGEKARRGVAYRDPALSAAEEMLEDHLGTRVEIASKAGRGSIKVYFYSDEELKRMIRELSGD